MIIIIIIIIIIADYSFLSDKDVDKLDEKYERVCIILFHNIIALILTQTNHQNTVYI